MVINIQGIDKAELLAALFNNSKPLGMGFPDPLSSSPMTKEQAQTHLSQGNMSFDYLNGRVMKINISGDEMEPRLYDRDNGEGAANRVVESIRKTNALSSQMNTNQNPKISAITDIRQLPKEVNPPQYEFKIQYEDGTNTTQILSGGSDKWKDYEKYLSEVDKQVFAKHRAVFEPTKIKAITDIKELSQDSYPARYQFKIKYEDNTEKTETLSGPELIKGYKQYIDLNDINLKKLLEYEIWPKPEPKISAIIDIEEITGTLLPPDYKFKIQFEDGRVETQSLSGASACWKQYKDYLSEEHNTLFSTYLSLYGDPLSGTPSEKIGFLEKTVPEESLLSLLKSYKEERSQDQREYFHFYSFFTGYSKSQKLEAVQAVIDILEQGKGTLDPKQLKICYQGRIGDRIREWEKDNNTTLIQVAERATSQLNPSEGG